MDFEGNIPPAPLSNPLPNQDDREELPVAKVELTEKRSTEQSIVSKVDAFDPQVLRALVAPWGEHCLVLEEGGNLRMFDETLHQDEGFDRQATTKSVFGYKSLTDNGWQYLAVPGTQLSLPAVQYTDNIKAPKGVIHHLVNKRLRGRTYFRIYDGMTDEFFNVANLKDVAIHTVQNGKYLVLINSETKDFIVFNTQNQAGTPIVPRNWERFDTINHDIDDLPSDIQSFVREALATSADLVINEKYQATVNDDGLVISDSQGKVFGEYTRNIGNNLCADPLNPSTIFFCSTDNPSKIVRIQTDTDPSAWHAEEMEFPVKFSRVRGLQLDPNGTCFLVETEKGLVFLDRDTLEPLGEYPDLREHTFDSDGDLRAITTEGKLVEYQTNIDTIRASKQQRRAAQLLQGIQVTDPFSTPQQQAQPEAREQVAHLEPVKERFGQKFEEYMSRVTKREDLIAVRQSYETLKRELHQKGLQDSEVTYVTAGILSLITDKERTYATEEARGLLENIATQLASSDLSISVISEIRHDLSQISQIRDIVSDEQRTELSRVEKELSKRSAEIFRTHGEDIEKLINAVLTKAKDEIANCHSIQEFDLWQDSNLPQFVYRLRTIAEDCPLEAEDARKKIIDARRELNALSETNEKRFKQEYARVRERAASVIDERVSLLQDEINSFLTRVQTQGFTSRSEAEQYIARSGAKANLEEDIRVLERESPEKSKELARNLRVGVANLLGQIERGGALQVAESGQQMVLFGSVPFPKWEHHVKEKGNKKTEVTFVANEGSRGPGIGAREVMGDLGVTVTNAEGKKETVRLWEGLDEREDTFRYGNSLKRVAESYVTKEEYDEIMNRYRDWSRGDSSMIKQKVSEARKPLDEINTEIAEFYAAYPDTDRRELRATNPELVELYRRQQDAFRQYETVYKDERVGILKRLDRLMNMPEPTYANGKGYVPEWQSHWVLDLHTEEYLEEMAELLKMQLDTREGILNLKGHAGTGKDVLVKMFCQQSNRPYFAIDCSKWTTEFELSEDVVLEAEGGATQTVKVPSIVLEAITTPGAVMYFNEFNAMPEQAQIFLHGLFDEKRSLTLKTSSGKTIKADPSVLFISSMNPGYPGTFMPQFATRSRMVSMEIDYPPLTREAGEGDPNRNPLFDASEPLRIAREVASLENLTFESNPDHNEFVKLWDHYVNGLENGAPEPTTLQRYDLDVIVALTQFASRLRQYFIAQHEGSSQEKRAALPVTQPLTGREMRRAAYALSNIPLEEKDKDPEQAARDLLEKFFLTHIDNKDNRERIRKEMSSWASTRRVR